MQKRSKSDQSNWTSLKGLLKQRPNRKCVNCNSSGPQYVCLSFCTFVCTICAEIHLEFGHRIKSISLSTFTPGEISALQSGGNEKAREIYFKDWDFRRQTLPISSNVERLRDVISKVYVLNHFSGKSQLDFEGKIDPKELEEMHEAKPCRDIPTDEISVCEKCNNQEGSNDRELKLDHIEHDRSSHGKRNKGDYGANDNKEGKNYEDLDGHCKDNYMKQCEYLEGPNKSQDSNLISPVLAEQVMQNFDGLMLEGLDHIANAVPETDHSQDLQDFDFEIRKGWLNSETLLDIRTESETSGAVNGPTNPFEILSANQSMNSSLCWTTFDQLSKPAAEVCQSGVHGSCYGKEAVSDCCHQSVNIWAPLPTAETTPFPLLSGPSNWNLGVASTSDFHHSMVVSKNPFLYLD